MRRSDKQNVLNNANILAEQRYLQSKGLIKESESETLFGKEEVSNFYQTLLPEDMESLDRLVKNWFKWNPNGPSKVFDETDGNVHLVSDGKSAVFGKTSLEIGGNTYRINGLGMDYFKQNLLNKNGEI